MPADKDSTLEFSNIHHQHPVPFVIYADFEAIIEKMGTCLPNPVAASSTHVAKHTPCGYAYVVVDQDGKSIKPPVVYRGSDAVDHLLQALLVEMKELGEKLDAIMPLKMSRKDEEAFLKAELCYVCNKPLGDDRVRDHQHTGDGHYRHALHQKCNLLYQQRRKIPVIFHNLRGYDSHLIMEGLGKLKEYDINLIPNNLEKYISFGIVGRSSAKQSITLQFLDSFQFLTTSLEKLVENVDRDAFRVLKEHVPSTHVPLLLRKGIYPYEYMDSFNRFSETELPAKEKFFSSLSDETVSDVDYAHAQLVWQSFDISTLGEYHDLYVKTDVMLLADVFQNFRQLCLDNYSLDPCHLFTSPGLAWEACLKMTGVKFDLITDIDMHLFIEQGIRGGVSMISHRFAQANNRYLPSFDASKPSSYISYFDMNNLYGAAMQEKLPTGAFEWMPVMTEDEIHQLDDNGDFGYILQVDLEYPKDLHDDHNDYPLAPERMIIHDDMVSPIIRSGRRGSTVKKLVPNLLNKENYVLHFRNLKFYLAHGLKLTKVHRVLRFKQEAWLRPYIAFNTEKRKNATSLFEKNFYKLLNNAVYGKTMENLRNRRDVQLVATEKKAKKLVAAPSFHRYKIFNDDLSAIERLKTVLTLNRPIYVGFVILELSKLLMYRYHYDHVKPLYGDKATLLFTDTDSLAYVIETGDVYQDMLQHQALYDTSDYPPDHPLHSNVNKKKVGVMKDELAGCPGVEFVGLRPKMYSLKSLEEEKKTAKGVGRTIIKKVLSHEMFKDCLRLSVETRESCHRITHTRHQLHTTIVRKTALSPYDDKRYIREDGISTWAHGHWRIAASKEEHS